MSLMSTGDRLVYMANQIALNFAIAGKEAAALATADHISAFWDPTMKQRIIARSNIPAHGLDPIAQQAIEHLRSRGAPVSQTPATVFGDVDEGGCSDAG